MFIDAHAHLYGMDAEAVIARAKEALVDFIICPGTNPQTIAESVKIAEKFDNVFACVGFHPEDTLKFGEEEEKFLLEMVKSKKVVGIGEIGLDYHFRDDNKPFQKYVFERQLKIAHKLNLPPVIHIRDAMEDALEILEKNKDLLSCGAVVHCFSGNCEDAKRILALGLDFTFGGICTFKNSKQMQEAIKFIPLEHILLETDTPYLAPEPLRGSVNEPKNIPLIAEKIASLKGENVEKVGKITTQNAKRVFKI